MKQAVKLCGVLAIIGLAAFAGSAKEKDDQNENENSQGSQAYTIALFGDQPYNALGKSQYPALLADINRAHVAFSVHDGDLKSGGDGPCSDSLYYSALAYLNTLERPLIFTPRANYWTV